MDFAYSPKVRDLEARLKAFMDAHVYPNEKRFRAAAIFQGVMARAVAGNAASAQALQTGERARPTAEFGWSLVRDL